MTAYDYSQDTMPLGDNILSRMSALADKASEAEKAVEAAELALKTAKEEHRDIIERQLPELMDEAGQKGPLKTASGKTIELVEILRASIPRERLNEALKWLREHDQESVIKTQVSVSYGKGEAEKAKAALKALRAVGGTPDIKETVHPQTLQATLRELLGEGEDVPLDVFGAVLQKMVKVKEPKTA